MKEKIVLQDLLTEEEKNYKYDKKTAQIRKENTSKRAEYANYLERVDEHKNAIMVTILSYFAFTMSVLCVAVFTPVSHAFAVKYVDFFAISTIVSAFPALCAIWLTDPTNPCSSKHVKKPEYIIPIEMYEVNEKELSKDKELSPVASKEEDHKYDDIVGDNYQDEDIFKSKEEVKVLEKRR